MTHYVAYFTVERSTFRGRTPTRQQAVCGEFVERGEHTAEPDCPVCAAWLQQEAADEAETFAALGYEQIQPGVWTPKEA